MFAFIRIKKELIKWVKAKDLKSYLKRYIREMSDLKGLYI